MSKELDLALVEIINSTKDAVGKGVSFLNQQLPDVVQQLLVWKWYEGLITIGFLILFFIVVGVFNWYQFKKCKIHFQKHSYLPDWAFWNFLQILLIIPLGGLLANIYTLTQLYYAPKIFLIEYAAHLVK